MNSQLFRSYLSDYLFQGVYEVSEQWVYLNNGYVYLDNGIVTLIKELKILLNFILK